jgi:molybdopterin/thiamine biosynthesis adenylyltransferase
MTNFSKIHEALINEGFKLTRSLPFIIYTGSISSHKSRIPIELVFFDKNLVTPPSIKLLEMPDYIPTVCAHINNNGYLCYINGEQAHLTREDLAGGVIGCLRLAEKLLNRLINGDALTDTQDEFPIYWQGSSLLIDIPKKILPGLIPNTSFLKIIRKTTEDHEYLIGLDQEELFAAYAHWDIEAISRSISLRVIDSNIALGATASNWPPKTLQDLKHWLIQSNNPAVRELSNCAKDAYLQKKDMIIVLIRAPNASCAALVDFKDARKVIRARTADEFMRIIFNEKRGKPVRDQHSHPKSWAAKSNITRLTPIPADPQSWLTRNLSDLNAGLSEKRIALIGVGAIGGYLADLLAKSGAGFLGGELRLIDTDELSVGNIGRHILGFGDIGLAKTKGMKNLLEKNYPRINVTTSDSNEKIESAVRNFDLIIDATGNQGLSNYLNELKLKELIKPPILFAWVAGTGCGSQAYLFADKTHACLRCLEYDSPGSNGSIMRRDYKVELKNTAGSCGDWLVPFSAPAAIHAAALAADLATGWSKGVPNPRFRSITIDYINGKTVKPTSPLTNMGCKTCK